MRKISILFVLAASLLFVACQQTQETSIENLEWYLSQNKICLNEITFGGIAGSVETCIHFTKVKDSIEVSEYVRYLDNQPSNKYNISQSKFEKIKETLKCMVANHSNEPTPNNGCMPPFHSEYFLKRINKRMRIYEPTQKCEIANLFMPTAGALD